MQVEPLALLIISLLGAVSGVLALLMPPEPRRQPWACTPALAASLGFAATGALSLAWPEASWLAVPAFTMAAAWGALALLRTGLLTALARALAAPRAQAILLALGGSGLAVFALYQIEQEHLSRPAEEEQLLNLLTASHPDLSSESFLAGKTEAGRVIPVYRLGQPDESEAVEMSADDSMLQRLGLTNQVIQTAPADGGYNCHGWVFAEGQGWVRGEDVPAILEDHRYQKKERPEPGDLALYCSGGAVTHSGIVRGVADDGSALVESKWGVLGRYIHRAGQHLSSTHQVTYYRTPRGNHGLKDLGSSDGPDVAE
jgi:hypothetical protein